MKSLLMILPLLVVANVAMGQGAEPEAMTTPDEAQAPDRSQAQRRGDVRDSHDRYMGKQRQGRDMRHCLNLKTNEAIIRCAEPGHKP